MFKSQLFLLKCEIGEIDEDGEASLDDCIIGEVDEDGKNSLDETPERYHEFFTPFIIFLLTDDRGSI